MDQGTAREALAGVGAAEARLAQAMHCPPWRHAAFGAIMAGFVGSLALPMPFQMLVTTLMLACVAVLVTHDRRRMGVFVNGYRKGATRIVAFATLGAMLVLMAAELHLRSAGGNAASKLGVALLAFVFATAASVVWQRVFVRELTR